MGLKDPQLKTPLTKYETKQLLLLLGSNPRNGAHVIYWWGGRTLVLKFVGFYSSFQILDGANINGYPVLFHQTWNSPLSLWLLARRKFW
jgi:hypothetical protein